MTSAHGLPPTPSRVIDLEDTVDKNGTVNYYQNRLPVFRNLKDESSSSSIQSRNGHDSTALHKKLRVPSVQPGSSVEQLPSVPSIFIDEKSFSVTRKRVSSNRYVCGGNCDGVTCISTASCANDAPCLKAEAIKKDKGEIRMPDLSGLPSILHRLCPFHHHISRWLVASSAFCFIAL